MKQKTLKTVLAFLSITILVLASTTIVPAQGEPTINARQLKSISLSPLSTSRDGNNVALTITATKSTKLPTAIAVNINEKTVMVNDDGVFPDAVAGDGIYSIAGRADKVPARATTIKLTNGHSTSNPTLISGECTIETVTCPKGCKSPFGFDCVICFKIKCTITFGSAS